MNKCTVLDRIFSTETGMNKTFTAAELVKVIKVVGLMKTKDSELEKMRQEAMCLLVNKDWN